MSKNGLRMVVCLNFDITHLSAPSTSGFKNIVEERDCGGHVGDPVQAGEGGDQGEGGGVRGCEGAALGGVQPLEGHAGCLVVLAAVADHILGDVHPDHLSHAVQ